MQTLIIKPDSDLLCATGESNAFVDANPVFDKHGLPYLKGKTFRGLLKEAAKEVEEIMQQYSQDYKGLAIELFGDDTTEGKIQVPDVQIQDYDAIVKAIQKSGLKPQDCRSYFTISRKQTALKDNIAKENSLRTYKLLRSPRVKFEVTLDYPESFSALMDKVFLQLRHVGVRRNRGFGKITINKSGDYIPKAGNKILKYTHDSDKQGKLKFTITALDDLHISRPVGDQNTESTEDFIPGPAIRGIIARVIINRNSLGTEAHKDNLFKDLVLGNIVYSNAYIRHQNGPCFPMSFAVGFDKTDTKKIPVNVMESTTGGVRFFPKWCTAISKPGENVSVKLTQHFHQSRVNRKSGRSTETEGAIFYYESIAKGQSFSGEISGPENFLILIQSILEEGSHRVGGSRATQYGRISFSCEMNHQPAPVFSAEPGEPFYLVGESHLLLYNEYGFSQPTPEVLNDYLNQVGLELAEPYTAASRTTRVEAYYTPWNARTDMEYAYTMGSTFKVIVQDSKKLAACGFLFGERQNEGFGKFRLYRNFTELDLNDRKVVTMESTNTAVNEKLPEILQKILEEKQKQANLEKLKLSAITWAENPANQGYWKNHQLSRLSNYLRKTDPHSPKSIDEWKKLLQENNETRMVDELDIKCLKNNHWNVADFGKYKTYWLNVFQYLRVKNRKNA